jgi:hypothetical protein
MYSFLAQSPQDPEETWEVGVSERDLKKLIHDGHKEKLARARLIEEVFDDPTTLVSIIQGWGRNKDECVIYVTSPGRDYRSDSIETPGQPGRVFLIFVLPDGTIDDWCWRDVASDGLPDGVKGDTVWPPS